jgi:hypothetical protein
VTLTETDPNPADNSATRNTPVVQGADLKLTASVTASRIAVGGSTTLNLLITNNGPVATTATSAVISVPSNLSFNGFIGASWSCTAAGSSPQIVTCTAGAIANGASTPALAVALNAVVGMPTDALEAWTVGSIQDPVNDLLAELESVLAPPAADERRRGERRQRDRRRAITEVRIERED